MVALFVYSPVLDTIRESIDIHEKLSDRARCCSVIEVSLSVIQVFQFSNSILLLHRTKRIKFKQPYVY